MLLRFILILLTAFSTLAAPVKLAIVETSAGAADAGSLFTAALSKDSSLALLERAALDKIVKEKSLSGSPTATFLAASQILGADSVLFLEANGPKENRNLNLRLVSVKEGAVLYSLQAGTTSESLGGWVEVVSPKLISVCHKLGADRAKVVPIAVLNLRSPSANSASELLDRELTSLLLVRLARETNLLLLERRKLLDLALEKDFAANTEQFWSGAYLLDGAVNKEGFQADRTTVSLRLIAPDKSAQTIDAAGARTNLAAVVEQLVQKILTSVHVGAASNWDPKKEAQEHADEAAWALRWRMYPEAQAAADSAWALGLQTPVVAATRALAYGRDRADWDPTLGFGGAASSILPSHPPLPERTATVINAVTILNDLLSRDPAAVSDKDVLPAAAEMLDKSGLLLTTFYYMVEIREGKGDQLAEWRRMCRNIQSIALKNPTVRAPFSDTSYLEKNRDELHTFSRRTNVFQVTATYTGIFSETPEQAISVYRDLIPEEGFPLIRRLFTSQSSLPPVPPPKGGWKWADRKRHVAVWDSFVQELCASTNVFAQMEGRVWDLHAERDWEQYKAKRAKFIAFLEEHWDQIGPRKNRIALLNMVQVFFHSPGIDDPARRKEIEALDLESQQWSVDHLGVPLHSNWGLLTPKTLAPSQQPRTNAPVIVAVTHSPPLQASVFTSLATFDPNWVRFEFESPIFRNGKFWFRINGATQQPHDHAAEIFSFDLRNKSRQMIPLPTNAFRFRFISPFPNGQQRVFKTFEVTSNELCVVEGSNLFRHSLRGGTWTSQTLPVKDPDLYLVNGQLYLSDADSIYELDQDGSARLLASARRRPSATLLDAFPILSYPPLGSGPNRSLRAFINGNAYSLNDRDWTPLTTLTNLHCIVRDDAAFFRTGNFDGFSQIHCLPATETNVQYLAVGVHSKTDPALYRSQTNRWVLDLYDLHGSPFLYESIPALLCQGEQADPKDLAKWRLLFYPLSASGPVDVPLELDEPMRKTLHDAFYRGFRYPWVLNTPDGLLFGQTFIPGFWTIPKSEIDLAVSKAMRLVANSQNASAK